MKSLTTLSRRSKSVDASWLAAFFRSARAIAALVGATAGLLLVYTTDLPQVDALGSYRPSSITELYDDHGRVIGSFALQRRVVAATTISRMFLRDALVSIEDKDFYRHSRNQFLCASWARPIATSTPAARCKVRRR